jgi:hypothetical protein
VKVFNSDTGALLHVLVNPSPDSGDSFGNSVAMSGTRIVVGAPSDNTGASGAGGVYVYDLSSATPTTPVFTIPNPNPMGEDQFGFSLAIDGDNVAVGAVFQDSGATDTGCVYVFDLSSALPSSPVATFNQPAAAAYGAFGSSVSISGTRVAVGALYANGFNSGSAYVFDLTSNTPTVPIATLNSPDGPGTKFASSVCISGTRVVIGASDDGTDATDAGITYVYELTSGTPTAPALTLHIPEPSLGDHFGSSVYIAGPRVAIGAAGDDAGGSYGGAIYVYDLDGATPSVPVATLHDPEPDQSRPLGTAISISGTRVIAAVPSDSFTANLGGSAFVFDLSSPNPTVPVARLAHASPQTEDRFGWSAAISGTRMALAAPFGYPDDAAGVVYVYDLAGGSPTLPQLTLANPAPPPGSHSFGYSIAMSGSLLVVGAPDNRVELPQAGGAYVYDLASSTPTVPVVVLKNPTPAEEDHFGNAVSISGNLVVVGAFEDDAGALNSGVAYVYDLASATPAIPVATLANPTPGQYDYFGYAVAISGTKVAVGTPGDSAAAGSVHFYDLAGAAPTQPVTVANPGSAANDNFGYSVALSDSTLTIGAPFDFAQTSRSGAVYIYDLAGGTPAAAPLTLNQPAAAAGDQFGYSVAISNTRVVVGARNVDTAANNAGAAYIFDLGSATPTAPLDTLNNPMPSASDQFGAAVAMDGPNVIIGAPYEDTVAYDKGYAYMYSSSEAVTFPPKLAAPVSNTVNKNPVSVTFTLPEAALPGSLTLTFSGNVNRTLTLASALESIGTHSFSFAPASPSASPEVAGIGGGAGIPDGTYSLTLSYQDAEGNPAATDTVGNLTIDTVAPVISGNFLPIMLVEGNLPNYLSQAMVVDANAIVELTQDPPAGSATVPGIVTVLLKAKDTAGNEGSTGLGIVIRPAAPVIAAILAQGDEAPGAGIPDGPPAGATLASFGVPAIDADGHVAFKASWTSAEGPGTGIFRDETFVAKAGGAVRGLQGASYKAFTDPVIEAGRVAFLATINGVPKAQSSVVVFSHLPGILELVAQTGTSAPQTGGQPFKSFKSVLLSGNKLGVFAYITSPKSFANDMGVWVKKMPFFPLELTFRETYYFAVDGEIKKLNTFTGGNGSPGQGRGWLIDTGDSAQVLTYASLADKSQAIIAAPLNDLPHPAILLRSGSSSGFTSFGLPSVNPSNQIVFLGSLAIGADMTKANARGIFADLESDGTCSSIVRAGDAAIPSGSTFSLLKDPVLAADGGLAFPATLKGKTVKGLATQTLWWKPPGGELTLLAQGGASTVPVADLPGAQWKSFPSLAIAANRGPIFTGTLVPGKGGVTKATSSGLWAVDFEGNLRLLVQSGVTQVDGKTVKSFTLLNSNVGSQGSTRSFNDNAQVVWRATFEDKSQAIVTTEIP